MNVFQRVTDRFGEDAAKEAIGFVDWYVDKVYPHFTHREHKPLTRALRMTFAEKLLECAGETYLEVNDIARAMLAAAKRTDQRRADPTIFYITTPRVLGYWFLTALELDYTQLRGTAYEPVDTYY